MQKKSQKIRGITGVVITVLLLLLLIFFTLYGDDIYKKITPKVPVTAPTETYLKEYALIEPGYLTEDGSLYLVASESGFSRTIYRIRKQKVEICGVAEVFGKIMIPQKTVMGCYIVTDPKAAEGLKDGDKVQLK